MNHTYTGVIESYLVRSMLDHQFLSLCFYVQIKRNGNNPSSPFLCILSHFFYYLLSLPEELGIMVFETHRLTMMVSLGICFSVCAMVLRLSGLWKTKKSWRSRGNMVKKKTWKIWNIRGFFFVCISCNPKNDFFG